MEDGMAIFRKSCYKLEANLQLFGSYSFMEQEQLKRLKIWFDNYVCGFYGENEYVNANIRLKEQHTQRTCEEMLYLGDQLGLSDNQMRVAEAIALLHDIGRFEQFVKYRTYHDPRSVDHCLLGLEVLRRTKVLEGLDSEERQLIETAIEYHGSMELPGGLDGECLLFSKLIRDADKLDIFFVMEDNYRQYRENPEQFKLEVELPDEPQCSVEVVEKLLAEQRIDYRTPRTWNDMKLCQLGWVYDVNFPQTLGRITERGFLENIFDFLPDNEDIRKVRKKIFDYVGSRTEQDR
ncbi:MAG: HD domain-containing protein [Planctomycetota bacterium]